MSSLNWRRCRFFYLNCRFFYLNCRIFYLSCRIFYLNCRIFCFSDGFGDLFFYLSGALEQAFGALMRMAFESVGAMQSTVTGVVMVSALMPVP